MPINGNAEALCCTPPVLLFFSYVPRVAMRRELCRTCPFYDCYEYGAPRFYVAKRTCLKPAPGIFNPEFKSSLELSDLLAPSC